VKDEFFGIDLSVIPQTKPMRDPNPECDVPVMAYVPVQQLCSVYQPEQALTQGTLFPELDKPFKGGMVRG
jgi:hypothetical protein